MKWYSIPIVIIIILCTIFVQRKYFPTVEYSTHTDTIPFKVDTIVYKDKPVPYRVEVPIIDTFPMPVDSAALVAKYLELHKEYMTSRYYADTTVVDSMGTITTSYKVTQNKSFDYKLQYNLERKKIINTTTIANSKNSLYIGGILGVNNVTPTIIFNNKDKYLYFGGYNVIRNEVNIGVVININKIRLW